jgi:hypothetical protein
MKQFRLLIAAACLFQEADDKEADTRLSETPAGQVLIPILLMLRNENFFFDGSPGKHITYEIYLLLLMPSFER